MLKKIIIFLTSLLLILNSTLSNATTVGTWTLSNPMAVGASILYDGSKGAVTSSVLITPNASQVAKALRGGVAGYALTLAVEQLLGVVDWVMDPANNRIIILPQPHNPTAIPSTLQYGYSNHWDGKLYISVYSACKVLADHFRNVYGGSFVEGPNPSGLNCNILFGYDSNNRWNNGYYTTLLPNPSYDPNKEPEEETLSLETVAQKVIENAESDNLDAQFAVLAAANTILAEAEQDVAKAKPIEDELEENKNNNCNPPAGVKFNKVTHYDRHGRDPDPNVGSHGCMAKTGSPVHWHYSVNHQLPDGRCVVQKHAFGGCGVAPP